DLVDFGVEGRRDAGEEFGGLFGGQFDSAEHPAHEHFRRRYRMARELLTDAFEGAEGRGDLRPPVTPRVLATLLLSVLDGVQLQWLLDPEEVDMRETVSAFIADLLGPPASA
ncbi:TetR family transcriptional regulator C-terminal domain-containing protein, partial [Streptomyces sp. NPDC005921]